LIFIAISLTFSKFSFFSTNASNSSSAWPHPTSIQLFSTWPKNSSTQKECYFHLFSIFQEIHFVNTSSRNLSNSTTMIKIPLSTINLNAQNNIFHLNLTKVLVTILKILIQNIFDFQLIQFSQCSNPTLIIFSANSVWIKANYRGSLRHIYL
jgi:hypothetical protein